MYYLVYKIDPNNHAKVLKQQFESEVDAFEKACALLTAGEAFACALEDDKGIVADDTDVAELCEQL
jgi:hypothetical protein